ncbi:HDIG domain protein [Desulfosarcina widdelii]|uniref:HDIG domain protein n=1 Tax=Desulfosarcina widdelii TaxID=947919 RepID=A0A5K7YVH5_9BACT|nr:HDOD domain-containing protein [Desulfosarcina widdelii]BBO73316.1 HDIG domain protein [Desulfosarcina widdelii]
MILTITSILEEIDHLKPVADVAGKVMALLDDPDCGTADLSEIICHEPALTANVLKLANSSYFGLPGKIEDARQAIVYLGMDQVIDLILLVSCSKSFRGSHEGYGLDAGKLWESAVSAAIVAGDLADLKGIKPSSLAFTGALLRDIGKVVLNRYVRTGIESILALVKSLDITFKEAERRVIGFDHAQIGAMLAEKWHFPPSLQCILRCYHTPLLAKECYSEASVVYLADAIIRKMGIGNGIDDDYYKEDEDVARSLELSESQIQDVIDGFEGKMDRVRILFASD